MHEQAAPKMTFEDLNKQLPNGFHDSTICEISVDFLNSSILLKMELHVSVEGDRDREHYRLGTLKVIQPYLFYLEPPDPNYPFVLRGKPLNASGASVHLGKNPKVDALLKSIPRDATAFVFFLDDWNSYLYAAGVGVEFSW